MPTTLTPAQVAKIANVSVSTIRNWSRDYAALLSESAAASPRLFTEEDVTVIRDIAAHPIVDAPTISPQQSLQSPTDAVMAPLQSLSITTAAYEDITARLEALERRQGARSDWAITFFLLGVAVAVIIGALVLAMTG